jgi:hypothetical protein
MQLIPCGDRQEVGHFAEHMVKCCHNQACPLCNPRFRYVLPRAVNVSPRQPKIPPCSLKSCLCDTDDLLNQRDCRSNSLELHSMRALCRTCHILSGLCWSRVCQGAPLSQHLHYLARDNPGCHTKLETLEFFHWLSVGKRPYGVACMIFG